MAAKFILVVVVCALLAQEGLCYPFAHRQQNDKHAFKAHYDDGVCLNDAPDRVDCGKKEDRVHERIT